MNLQRQLAAYFPRVTRQRGEMMFQFGQVTIVDGSKISVDARVMGSRQYEVELWLDKANRLDAQCDCPFYLSSGPCKHIWAVVLASDKRGFLQGARPGAPIHFVWGEMEEADIDPGEPLPSLARVSAAATPPVWKRTLDLVNATSAVLRVPETRRSDREIFYALDLHSIRTSGTLNLTLMCREKTKSGVWGKVKALKLARHAIGDLAEPADRETISLLAGVGAPSYTYGFDTGNVPESFRLTATTIDFVMPKVCATGRCLLRTVSPTGIESDTKLSWDDGPAWKFQLSVERHEQSYFLRGTLRRGDERMDIREALLIVPDGMVGIGNRLARLEPGSSSNWIAALRRDGEIEVPVAQGEAFLSELLGARDLPPVDLPSELSVEQVEVDPQPSMHFAPARDRYSSDPDTLRGRLSFDYQGKSVALEEPSRGLYDSQGRRFVRRNPTVESQAVGKLRELNLNEVPAVYDQPGPRWEVPSRKLPMVVRELVQAGWHVDVEGKAFRSPTSFRAELTSGIDWFELHGTVEYEGTSVSLPELLKAVQRGETMIQLGDGGFGVLPEEFIERYAALIRFGKADTDHVRFSRAQTGLLDVFLAERAEIKVDDVFRQARDRLLRFDGIHTAEQPDGFTGELRGYQKEGLAWMQFLQSFGWGGCLADDMGVGKTPQVLALLETRRAIRQAESIGPSVVVVPRSLVYNWQLEAARFTPQLRVLDHTGADRDRSTAAFANYDLILATYGTLRRDVLDWKDFRFDYAILDEAQAIKNPGSESAKAARLLHADHKLALSGTPIENHLGELWSLFEFLNPGMLGAGAIFQTAKSAMRNPNEDTRRILARAVRPFILRRTKQQVARELPEKLEQTIYCELDAAQRKQYNELKEFYRRSLLGRVDKQGISKSRIQILEALLRLRQVACHPGLIDTKRKDESSAKLEVLLPHLQEVMEEGHKALVFSQFTSLLDIVRRNLDRDGVIYEYLDGKTKDRQARVERFQGDPDCKLFLISLKAGGVGLNLTAADYVFLLDPWWNPAVESQAIDRAHRIGQQRAVFAYRLIARETVEEKVLELQKSKRDLADAIITEDNRLVGNLTREDLEMLFS